MRKEIAFKHSSSLSQRGYLSVKRLCSVGLQADTVASSKCPPEQAAEKGINAVIPSEVRNPS
jgi:hypothetical protein